MKLICLTLDILDLVGWLIMQTNQMLTFESETNLESKNSLVNTFPCRNVQHKSTSGTYIYLYNLIYTDGREESNALRCQKTWCASLTELPPFVYFQSVVFKSGFRSLADGEEVEFESCPSDKGVEATYVSGPSGSECRGSDRRPLSRKKFRKIRFVLGY